jgi:hypothetical protein
LPNRTRQASVAGQHLLTNTDFRSTNISYIVVALNGIVQLVEPIVASVVKLKTQECGTCFSSNRLVTTSPPPAAKV